MIGRIPYAGSGSPGPPPGYRNGEFNIEVVHRYQRKAYTIREIAGAAKVDVARVQNILMQWLFRN